MHIVSTAKFVLGIVFFLLAIGLAARSRRERGFGQQRQAAALCLIASGVFGAMGLGYLD
jgi:Kef-type K+ transport system membrane component KefB